MQTELVIDQVANELDLSKDELILQGIRALLERDLHRVEAQIFDIAGRFGVLSVAEMDARYQVGTLAESESWRDYQQLDHLEYKRDRLLELLKDLP